MLLRDNRPQHPNLPESLLLNPLESKLHPNLQESLSLLLHLNQPNLLKLLLLSQQNPSLLPPHQQPQDPLPPLLNPLQQDPLDLLPNPLPEPDQVLPPYLSHP